MQFTPEQVKRLYGPILFQLPLTEREQVENVAEEPATVLQPAPAIDSTPFVTGEPPVWKTKPNARFGMVLTQEEFRDRTLTKKLKDAVLSAGISLDQVGFGVYDQSLDSWNFSEMPFESAVIFGACGGKLTQEIGIEKGTLLPAPYLQVGSMEELTGLLRRLEI